MVADTGPGTSTVDGVEVEAEKRKPGAYIRLDTTLYEVLELEVALASSMQKLWVRDCSLSTDAPRAFLMRQQIEKADLIRRAPTIVVPDHIEECT